MSRRQAISHDRLPSRGRRAPSRVQPMMASRDESIIQAADAEYAARARAQRYGGFAARFAADPFCPIHGRRAGGADGLMPRPVRRFYPSEEAPMYYRAPQREGGLTGSVTVGGIKHGSCFFSNTKPRNINVRNKLQELADALRIEKKDGCYMRQTYIMQALDKAADLVEAAAKKCAADDKCGKAESKDSLGIECK